MVGDKRLPIHVPRMRAPARVCFNPWPATGVPRKDGERDAAAGIFIFELISQAGASPPCVEQRTGLRAPQPRDCLAISGIISRVECGFSRYNKSLGQHCRGFFYFEII